MYSPRNSSRWEAYQGSAALAGATFGSGWALGGTLLKCKEKKNGCESA